MLVGILGHSRSGKDTLADYVGSTYGLQKIAFADPMKRLCRSVFDFSKKQLWGSSTDRNALDPRYVGPNAAPAFYEAAQKMWDRAPSFVDEVLPFFTVPQKRKAFEALWVWFDLCASTKGLTARFALQTLGSEWGRDTYPDVWARYMFETVVPAVLDGTHTYSQGAGLYPRIGLAKLIRKPKGIVIPDMRFFNEIDFGRRHDCVSIRLRRHGADGKIEGGMPHHRSEELQKVIPDSDLDAVLDVPEGLPQYYRAIDSLFERQLRPHFEAAAAARRAKRAAA